MAQGTRAYHHGNLRAALIQAGLELIEERGIRAFTLREIGARLGVSRMAAYRHFADKGKLLAAMKEVGFEKFAAALEEGRNQAGLAFAAGIRSMSVAYVRFAREYPSYFAVMFSSDAAQEQGEKSAAEVRAFHILQQAIEDGQARGEARPGNSVLMACTAWSMVHGIGALRLEQLPFGEGRPLEDFVVDCADLLLAGLSPARKNAPQ